MKKYRILFLLMIPVVAATLFFTARITTKLSRYEEKKLEKAELLDAETRLGNAWEWLPPWLSGGDDTMDESLNAKVFYDPDQTLLRSFW